MFFALVLMFGFALYINKTQEIIILINTIYHKT